MASSVSQNLKAHYVPMRLRKFLSKYTKLSNKEIKEAWDAGLIRIERKNVEQQKEEEMIQAHFPDLCGLRSIVFPQTDRIFLENRWIEPVCPIHQYFAFHKPIGVECVVSDDHSRVNRYDTHGLNFWMKFMTDGCVPVGNFTISPFSIPFEIIHRIRTIG